MGVNVMKRIAAVLIAACSVTLSAAAPALAAELVGKVISMTGSRLVLRSSSGETVRLEVTGQTKVFSDEMTVPVRRLLPDTRVRVSHANGQAEAIFIKGAPR